MEKLRFNQIYRFLKQCEHEIPPPGNSHHSLTVPEDGKVCLSIFSGQQVYPVIFDIDEDEDVEGMLEMVKNAIQQS